MNWGRSAEKREGCYSSQQLVFFMEWSIGCLHPGDSVWNSMEGKDFGSGDCIDVYFQTTLYLL